MALFLTLNILTNAIFIINFEHVFEFQRLIID